MSEKIFLVTMNDDDACDYRNFNQLSLFYCSRTVDNKPCGGDLKKLPSFCPLVILREYGQTGKMWCQK